MELKYRGIGYSTAAPSVEIIDTSEQGIFRGACFTWKQYRTHSPAQPPQQLRFLGHTYTR
ncbi:MAG TPA: DUF4278 domain-containing protein [Nodosilinea sp.]|nr:DUF4278 domain-containing protein [Nodosilinea sp.]